MNVHYTGTLLDGTIFSDSTNRNPLQFTIGEGQIIPGFEQAVVGMSPGESKTAKISVEQGFGPYHPEFVIEVESDQLPPALQPEVGQELEVQQSSEEIISAIVTDVSEEKVILDANHPLAGKELVFAIHLVEIAA